MLLALVLAAQADSITLDSGAIIEGDLARYEFGGDCQISVLEGPLAGAILIVPCHRVETFTRTSPRRPVAVATPAAPGTSYAPPVAAPAPAPVAAAEGPSAEEAAVQEELARWFEPVLAPVAAEPVAAAPAVGDAPPEAPPAPRVAEPLPTVDPAPAGGRPVSF